MILSNDTIDELKKNKEIILMKTIITILLAIIIDKLGKNTPVSYAISLMLIYFGLIIYIWKKWAWFVFIIFYLTISIIY